MSYRSGLVPRLPRPRNPRRSRRRDPRRLPERRRQSRRKRPPRQSNRPRIPSAALRRWCLHLPPHLPPLGQRHPSQAPAAASPAEPTPTSVSEVRTAPPAQPEQVTGFDDAHRGAQVVTNPRPEEPVKIETPTPPPAKTPAELAAEARAARDAAEAEAALLAPDPTRKVSRKAIVRNAQRTLPLGA